MGLILRFLDRAGDRLNALVCRWGGHRWREYTDSRDRAYRYCIRGECDAEERVW